MYKPQQVMFLRHKIYLFLHKKGIFTEQPQNYKNKDIFNTYLCLKLGKSFGYKKNKIILCALEDRGYFNELSQEYLKKQKNPFKVNKKIYSSYLNSRKWKRKRIELFKIRGKICERCFSKENIQVHHKTYKNVFREKMEELEVLCSVCHKKEHYIS